LPKRKFPHLKLLTGRKAAGRSFFGNRLGTELLHDAYVPGAYLTIDRWASEEAFRAFRKDHDGEYETLDRTCDVLTSRESRIGAYTV